MLKINPKKTKIMAFQKRARKCAEFRFYIGYQIIDVVQEYTYLGSRTFQWRVNFSNRKLFMHYQFETTHES